MRLFHALRYAWLVVWLAYGLFFLVRPHAQDILPLQPLVRAEGNTHSRIYHLPHCPWYGRLPGEKLKVFEGRTLDEAQARAENQGYRMARNCQRVVRRDRL